MPNIGKSIRLERIIDRNSKRTIIIPMDHGLTVGTIKGLEDMAAMIDKVAIEGANAVLEHSGMYIEKPGWDVILRQAKRLKLRVEIRLLLSRGKISNNKIKLSIFLSFEKVATYSFIESINQDLRHVYWDTNLFCIRDTWRY